MITDESTQLVGGWAATARHPKTGRLFPEMTCQPVKELLAYLRADGFTTFIVSGGGVEFMRPWVEQAYAIPPKQVAGSSIKTKFPWREAKPVLMRLPKLNFIDDKAGKPVGIHKHIGRRPIPTFGNSDGDFERLTWTTSAPGARLGMIVRHDDAEREYACERKSHIGKLDRGLNEAGARAWSVVSMKADWRAVFSRAR